MVELVDTNFSKMFAKGGGGGGGRGGRIWDLAARPSFLSNILNLRDVDDFVCCWLTPNQLKNFVRTKGLCCRWF